MGSLQAQLQALLEDGLEQSLYSGAAAGITVGGERHIAYAGTHARDDLTPVRADTVFDLASVSKTFTAAVITRLAAQGRVNLDEPVATVLPVGTGPGAERITLRMLLTHVSGLPAESFIWRDVSTPPPDRMRALLATALESEPDEVYRYSCVGYIAAGAVAERATGSTLPSLLDELITQPLHLTSVRYGPVDPARAAATEAQPWAGAGMLRGEVHDELNRYLGGCVGNAGLFGSAEDVLAFAESFTDDRLYESQARTWMTTDGLRPHHGSAFGQALGPALNDAAFLGDVEAFGHVGFTGTMWLADPRRRLAAALLTNNVHPHRDHADLTEFRQRFSSWAASRAGAI
ncbi:serine hydrolase domain-containing protein [Microbacterium sp. SSM24]|uniref:serine hydrolase domain-containing protein n=1 Tax=Microbacterium sp. SSM24 TaxID=2991714 RepID=UPI002226FC6B|nr:serine hydrolase domain-containing protein [Microbacterium sp. SSM24]MCW3492560.1 beta-lactamase family protein [Microbacterium sp. SSM24]